MPDLQKRNTIIQAYYKNITFADFVCTIASRYPLQLYKEDGLISMYPPSSRKNNILSPEIFGSSRDDLIKQWLSYNADQWFFEQFAQLFMDTPIPGFHHFSGTENCAYANHISNTKNGYLSFHATGECENVYYSISTKIWSKNIFNSAMAWIHSENIYRSIGVIKSYNIFYSKYIKDSANLWFCTNCIGCEECLLCDGLQNKKYHIRNQELSQEVYSHEKEKILAQKDKFLSAYAQLNRMAHNRNSDNCTGNFITDSQGVENGYFSHFVNQGKNVVFWGHEDGLTNAFSSFLVSGGRDYYGVCAIGWDTENAYCSIWLRKCSHIYYSYFLEWCSFCLWCVWLKNKQFCIFNTQYSKEDRHAKVDEIFGNMEKQGILWQFFPASINPFYYNDTAAALFDDKDEHTAKEEWFLWRNTPMQATAVPNNVIENHKGDFDESICDAVLKDRDGNMFTIQKGEYLFLRKHGLPLPDIHRLARMKLHLKQ